MTFADDDCSLIDTATHCGLVRDVCYMYHELVGYRHMTGDLAYSTDFSTAYWDLINRTDDSFVREGILVLFMAMLVDFFDESGDYILEHTEAISRALKNFVPESTEMLRLLEAVEYGLLLVATQQPRDDRYQSECSWVYEECVRGYFANNASA